MHISHLGFKLRQHSLPSLGSKLPRLESPPLAVDVYERSLAAEPRLSEAKESPIKENKGLAKAFGFALALTAGLVATSMPSVAVGAQVEMVQKSAVAKTLTKPKARALLAKLPKDLAKTASGFSDGQVRVLKGGLSGQTTFGPITVNHRKAFIKGKAAGMSVWSKINGQIRDARSKHQMINQREERELLQVVQRVARMSKGERSIMADLMDMVHVR